MVESIDWRFMARSGVRGRGRGSARIYGGGSQREKQSSCTNFVSRGESGPSSRSSTGTPKAVPKYATTRDHQHHGSTLHVAHGSTQLTWLVSTRLRSKK